MVLGYAGLALSFLMLIILFVWILVEVKPKKALIFLIPFLIWYAAVLWFVPKNFVGYPANGSPPDGSIILYGYIEEPSEKSNGGIYLYVLETGTKEDRMIFDPKIISEIKRRLPRNYAMPYDRSTHEKYTLAQNKKNKEGSLMIWRKGKEGKKKEGENDIEDKSGFRVINPEDVFRKK